MICEPNDNLPQKVDIASLRETNKPHHAAEDAELKINLVELPQYQVEREYNVLPRAKPDMDHLKTILSLKHNGYLHCRWHNFLEKIPDSYVRISLYTEFRKTKMPTRRKSLNGRFYSVDNKLIPIPVLPDPRQYNANKIRDALKRHQ